MDAIFDYQFTTNSLISLSVEWFQKRSLFGKVLSKSMVAFFPDTMHGPAVYCKLRKIINF